MIKKIQGILINNFEWMKKDLIIMVSLIFLVAMTFHFFATNEVLRFFIVIIMFVKSAKFSGNYSIQGSPMSKDQFSWKFLQGLPLTKKELICMLTASGLMSCIPLFTSVIFFSPEIRAIVNDEKYILNFSLILVASFLLIILGVLLNINQLIQYPRKEYQRQNTDKQLISFIRFVLVGGAILFSSLMAMMTIEERYDVDILTFIVKSIGAFVDIINSWWVVPFLIVIILCVYFETIKVWNNEKPSYKSNIYNPKKEYSLIAGSLVVLFILFLNIDFKTPIYYRGSLQKAVYQKNYSFLEKELKNKSNIHNTNQYGMTPMLVAVREGNIEMVKYLENRGANFEGFAGKKKGKERLNAILLAIDSKNVLMLKYIFNKQRNDRSYYEKLGFTPIHYAALICQPRMVDYLVQNDSGVDVLNKVGETPLLVASRAGCLSVAVTLKEHGASFDITDKKGKKALDIVKPSTKLFANDEIKYFIEKTPGPRHRLKNSNG